MKNYYSPEECRESIRELFQPIMNFWVFKDKFESAYLERDEEDFLSNPLVYENAINTAKENHEKILLFINGIPIENNKYLLLLIYEKVYHEMFNLIPDMRYDHVYLVNSFKEILNKI